MKNHWRDGVTRLTAALALWVGAIGVHASFAQARAKVTVEVSVPGDKPVDKKVGLKIRAISMTSGEAHDWPLENRLFNFTKHLYQYTFQGLLPGEYEFVVCDGLDYLPEMQPRTVQSGPNSTPVSFSIHAPKERGPDLTSPELKLPDGKDIEKDRTVYLKDVVTGCIVSSVNESNRGVVKFQNVAAKTKYCFVFVAGDQDPESQPLGEKCVGSQ